MAQQLKKIAFLAPRSNLSIEEFRSYWRAVHGPIVARSPGYSQYRRRYVQNHIIGRGPIGNPFAYAGMAEFWLPEQVSNEEVFSMSGIYRDRIRVDEEKFIDMDATISMTAMEQVIRPGTGAAKLIIVSRRTHLDDVTTMVESALREANFRTLLRGWTLNHILEGSFRLPGARLTKEINIDCVQELWFDTVDDVRNAIAWTAFEGKTKSAQEQPFRNDGQSSFLAEEVVFFDGGKPVVPSP